MKAAFTLIEVVIVIALLAIVTAAVLPSVGSFSSKNILNQELQTVASNVELAKFKALSGVWGDELADTGADWGVVFCPGGSTSSYILTAFETGTTTIIGTQSRAYSLPNNLRFKNSGIGNSCNESIWVFKRLSSTLSSYTGSKTLCIRSTAGGLNSYFGSISVEDSGKISVTTKPTCP